MHALQRLASWLTDRQALRAARLELFVGPPLPPGSMRLGNGRLCRRVSRWNEAGTMHTIDFVSLDGSPLPHWDD